MLHPPTNSVEPVHAHAVAPVVALSIYSAHVMNNDIFAFPIRMRSRADQTVWPIACVYMRHLMVFFPFQHCRVLVIEAHSIKSQDSLSPLKHARLSSVVGHVHVAAGCTSILLSVTALLVLHCQLHQPIFEHHASF